MGLDQWAYAAMPHPENTDFSCFWHTDEYDAESDKVTRTHDLATWRKHPNLQGWMEQAWLDKLELAGESMPVQTEGWFAGTVVFNCQPVRLTFEDLAYLEEAIKYERLPATSGFFFGGDSDDHYREQDLEFVRLAIKAIGQDMEVYYSSWW